MGSHLSSTAMDIDSRLRTSFFMAAWNSLELRSPEPSLSSIYK